MYHFQLAEQCYANGLKVHSEQIEGQHFLIDSPNFHILFLVDVVYRHEIELFFANLSLPHSAIGSSINCGKKVRLVV